MQIGETYLFDNSAGYKHSIKIHTKIISYDNYEVFVDDKRTDQPTWELDETRVKTGRFSRFSLSNFERGATKIGYEAYSDERLATLRPDLPMRLCRIKSMSWGHDAFETEESLQLYLKEEINPSIWGKKLEISQLYLEGYNKNGLPQKPILLEASNGEYFTVRELFYQANIIQANIKVNKGFLSDGVGLYRSGIKNGIPSYYIWGFYDLADTLRKYEEQGVDISMA
jgi:hypothetical protein